MHSHSPYSLRAHVFSQSTEFALDLVHSRNFEFLGIFGWFEEKDKRHARASTTAHTVKMLIIDSNRKEIQIARGRFDCRNLASLVIAKLNLSRGAE